MKSRDSDPAHCSVGFLGRVALVIPGRESRRGSPSGSGHRKVAFLCAERGFDFIYRYRESFCVLQYLQNSEILRYSRERIKMSFP